MRWEQLFADLEARFEIEEQAAQEGEAASRSRAEAGAIRLVDRLRGAQGHPVVMTCRGAGDVRGRVTDVGVDWLLVTDDQRREHLVALAGVRAVAGLGRETGVPVEGAVARAWDLRRCVRALARDRATVRSSAALGPSPAVTARHSRSARVGSSRRIRA